MTRPLVTAGFAYLIGLVIAAAFLPDLGFLALFIPFAAAAAAAVLISICKKELTCLSLAIICVTAALGQYGVVYTQNNSKAMDYVGTTGEVKAVIESIYHGDSFDTYNCRLTELNGSVTEDKILFKLKIAEIIPADIGDTLFAVAHFSLLDTSYPSTGSGYKAGEGIILSAETTEGSPEIVADGDYSPSFSQRINRFFSDRALGSLSLAAGSMTDAMLFGNRSSLSEASIANFDLSGTSHLLAISGFHLSVLSGFVHALMSTLGFGRRTTALTASVFVLMYMFITGFEYSVTRAGIMALASYLSGLTGREGDSLSSLGLAVLVICIVSPMAVWEYGFLMSVSAMLGIILIHGRFQDIYSAFLTESSLPNLALLPLRIIVPALSVSFSAQAAVFPLILATGNSCAPGAIISSVILSVPAGIILSGGLAAAILGNMGFTRLLGIIMDWSVRIMDRTTSAAASAERIALPFSGWVFVLFMCAVIVIFSLSRRLSSKTKFTAAVLCCSVVFAGVCIADSVRIQGMDAIYVSASSSGTGVVLVHDGKAFAVTTGSNTAYASRRFVADMGLELTDSMDIRDNADGEPIDIFGDGEVILKNKPVGVIITAFGKTIALNNDKRVSGEYDILIREVNEKNNFFIPSTARDFTIMCSRGILESKNFTDIMPEGQNLLLDHGQGYLLEFGRETRITEYNYNY